MSGSESLMPSVRIARVAAEEAAGVDSVGAHLRVEADGDGLESHVFTALQPGYRGWTWVVSLSVLAEQEPTVNDVVLLPGPEAIVAPRWTPYRERIRPGDLAPGDVLPPDEGDLRLVPSWSAGDGSHLIADRHYARDLAGGREWVLSFEGRQMAAQRWQEGPQGPDAAIAQQASGSCRTCGFLVGLSGALADRFGVCANGMANDDGRAVSLDHGCGAHSGVQLNRSAAPRPLPPPVFDTVTTDDVEIL